MRAHKPSLATLILAAALFAPGAQAFFVGGPTATPGGLGPLVAGTYAEVGDAGGVTSPQDVTGTGISQITGTIGPDFTVEVNPIDPTTATASGPLTNGFDTEDAFRFWFDGGDIGFLGFLHVPTSGGFTSTGTGLDPANGAFQVPLPLNLFAVPPDPVIPPDPIAPLVPYFVNLDHNDIRFQGLAAGNYVLQAVFTNFDPPFTIGLFGPTTGGPATVSTPRSVPEPATLALLGIGVAALAIRRRGRA